MVQLEVFHCLFYSVRLNIVLSTAIISACVVLEWKSESKPLIRFVNIHKIYNLDITHMRTLLFWRSHQRWKYLFLRKLWHCVYVCAKITWTERSGRQDDHAGLILRSYLIYQDPTSHSLLLPVTVLHDTRTTRLRSRASQGREIWYVHILATQGRSL